MESSPVGLSLQDILKKASADCLLSLLKSIPGKKDLILDDELISCLDHIATATDLKSVDVEKIFKLEPGASPTNTYRCVYLVRAGVPSTKLISDHINASLHANKNTKFWIIYVPRKLFLCELILEQEGVYGKVTFLEFPLGFIPLDADVFSLELMDFYPSFFLHGDQTLIHTAAVSLLQIQRLCGHIPDIFGVGRCARMVIDLMRTLMDSSNEQKSEVEQISNLVIIDRDVDYMTVLLTQLTYEGLLDETFGIKSGKVLFGKEVTGKEQNLKIVLNSSDKLYKEIRDRHFTDVFGFLRDKGKNLQNKSAELKQMKIGDVKKFVTNDLRDHQHQLQSLALHISAGEVIMQKKSESGDLREYLEIQHNSLEGLDVKEAMAYIEETINRQFSALNSLRLLCILSIAQEGLSTKDYKHFVTHFVQSHGYKYMITFDHLKTLGLFVEQSPVHVNVPVPTPSAAKLAGKVVSALPRRSSFVAVCRKLGLIPKVDDHYNFKEPRDMGYVFGGAYIPLACKLTEQVILKGIFGLEDITRLIPTSFTYRSPERRSSASTSSESGKRIIVYFLGGVTYAEVAALRLLGKMKKCSILIAATSIINGNSMLKLLCPDVP